MHKPTRFLSPHRRNRLTAWALAMLEWIASALFTERTPKRRHIRQRYGRVSLRTLTRFTCLLAIIRVVEISGIRPRRRAVRNAAPAGFRRRTDSSAFLRACIGARLRKAIKRGDLATRLRFLTAALSDIDAFARRYLLARALRRLTRLCPVVIFAPAAQPLFSAPAAPPAFADSS